VVVAGLDIATCTGCAILDGARVLHIEAFKATGKTEGEVFLSFRKWLRRTLLDHRVEMVAVEQPLRTDIEVADRRRGAHPGEKMNPVTMKTYLRLYGLRAHAIETCARLGLECREVHQASWRKAFAGSGRATKDDVLALAQRIVPGLKSKDASDALGVAWWLNGELRTMEMGL